MASRWGLMASKVRNGNTCSTQRATGRKRLERISKEKAGERQGGRPKSQECADCSLVKWTVVETKRKGRGAKGQ